MLGVSVGCEEVENPLLLLGSKHPLPSVVAVISAMTTQIALHFANQDGIVLLLHFLKEWFETIGRANDADLFEMGAIAIPVGCGEDGTAPSCTVGHLLTRQIAKAL